MTKLVYLVVYSGILFDIGIRGRNIGFRLIVVIVRDEIFYRVFREKLSEFGAELRRESLVGARTRVGRLRLAITFAIVKVLPDPVTPSRVCSAKPLLTPSVSSAIACG